MKCGNAGEDRGRGQVINGEGEDGVIYIEDIINHLYNCTNYKDLPSLAIKINTDGKIMFRR